MVTVNFAKLVGKAHRIALAQYRSLSFTCNHTQAKFRVGNNFSIRRSGRMSSKLNQVGDVDIDPSGRFKYILVKVYEDKPDSTPENENFKYVVRGYASCPFHGDIYDRLLSTLVKIGGLDSECVGGGRILHENKKLTVFGYSQGYGQADHSISVAILKKAYPDYEITWNNDGY